MVVQPVRPRSRTQYRGYSSYVYTLWYVRSCTAYSTTWHSCSMYQVSGTWYQVLLFFRGLQTVYRYITKQVYIGNLSRQLRNEQNIQ